MHIHIISDETDKKEYYIIILDQNNKYIIVELFNSNEELSKD